MKTARSVGCSKALIIERSVQNRRRMKPLGTPFNLTEGAALLSLIGRLTGYTPRWFTYFIGDAHVYENHLDMLNEQMTREPYPMPKLVISDRVPEFAKTGVYQPEWLELIEPSDFTLEGYQHHPAMTAPMAV
ncbi:thymidylate synthase [Pseudomonas syringae]|uniref:thymidylate synthase n=1 Tax=Pseudomonas syringae TaxID=317 RepID=UPI00322047D7